jgi:protein translocase SecG subunit
MQYLMYVAYVIYVAAAVLMIGAILLQEGKGGGLSALGGTQAESAFGASNPIRRMTVILAVLFFILAGFLSFMSSRESVSPGSEPSAAEESGGADGADAQSSPDAKEGDTSDGAPDDKPDDAAKPGDGSTSEAAPATGAGEATTPKSE